LSIIQNHNFTIKEESDSYLTNNIKLYLYIVNLDTSLLEINLKILCDQFYFILLSFCYNNRYFILFEEILKLVDGIKQYIRWVSIYI
jgi:hypothetical protein